VRTTVSEPCSQPLREKHGVAAPGADLLLMNVFIRNDRGRL